MDGLASSQVRQPVPLHPVTRSGVILMDLSPAAGVPRSLFPELQSPQHSRVDPVLDAVNRRFGANTLRFGVVGFDHAWSARRRLCSPCYTTCWEELPTVKAGNDSVAPATCRGTGPTLTT